MPYVVRQFELHAGCVARGSSAWEDQMQLTRPTKPQERLYAFGGDSGSVRMDLCSSIRRRDDDIRRQLRQKATQVRWDSSALRSMKVVCRVTSRVLQKHPQLR